MINNMKKKLIKVFKAVLLFIYKYSYYIMLLIAFLATISRDYIWLMFVLISSILMIGMGIGRQMKDIRKFIAVNALNDLMNRGVVLRPNGPCKLFDSINECGLYEENDHSCDGCPNNNQLK